MKSKRLIHQIGLLSCVIISSCSSENKLTEEKPALPVITISAQTVQVEEPYVAEIQAIKNVEIRNRVTGFLDYILVDEGKKVSKGQVLFKINESEYQTELAKATANLQTSIAEAKSAELEVNRISLLVEKQVIGKVELEMAKAKLAAAQAKIEEARSNQQRATLNLSYTTITAPFDGLLDRIPLKMGSLLQEGTLLTTISDIQDVYAYFRVSESQYIQYRRKRIEDSTYTIGNVKLILADGTIYPLEGKIETVEGDFETTTGTIAFRAKFNNPNRLLKHGSSGKVLITNTINNAIVIPQKAVFEIQDKNYVYVVNEQNQVKMKSFTTKKRLDKYYIVESGLQMGDKIVYEGIQNLKDGAFISPQPIKQSDFQVSTL